MTCAICEQGLAPEEARATDYGWMHAETTDCPRFCTIVGCSRPTTARGWCQAHWRHWRRTGSPEGAKPRVDAADRLEDVQWMAETGECLDGAAARLGLAPDTLELFLRRHDRGDLCTLLRSRNPRDHNSVADGSAVTSITLTPAAREGQRRHNEAKKARRAGVAA